METVSNVKYLAAMEILVATADDGLGAGLDASRPFAPPETTEPGPSHWWTAGKPRLG